MRVGTHKHGFTIVELLIVVVVIAILAAITIVAFNGIQERSRASAAQAVAKQAYTSIASFAVQNADTYPANLAAAGLTNSGDTTYQYQVNNSANPRTFCVTATKQNVSYYVSQSASAPVAGGCAGHAANGVVTNLVANPTFGIDAIGWATKNNSSIVRDPAFSRTGTHGLRVTTGSHVAAGAGFTVSGLIVGQTYTGSVWVYIPSSNGPTGGVRATWTSVGYGTTATASGQWTRIAMTFTATNQSHQFGMDAVAAASGQIYYVDDMMIHAGENELTYADGNSPGWTWSGTQHSSTSSGPSL